MRVTHHIIMDNDDPVALVSVNSLLLMEYVGFRESGKPKYPEKNPQSTGEINYEKRELSTHGRRKPDLSWLFQRRKAQCANRLATTIFLGLLFSSQQSAVIC